jgi:hypothetical protein
VADRATVLGLSNARFWANTDGPAMLQEAMRAWEREGDPNAPASYLALSGRSDNGAFGAGVLTGWSERGDRPTFKLVAGISTGALIAPFAFNGGADTISLGNGNDTVTANGSGDKLTFGNGNNSVTANGNNDTMTFGSGSNTGQALGSGDTITMNAATSSIDKVSAGSNDEVHIANGTDFLTANATGDIFDLNSTNLGTTVSAFGNNNSVFLGSNASALIHLNPTGVGERLLVQSLGGASGDNYSGAVEVSGFGPSDSIDLQSLVGGVNNQLLTKFGQVIQNMTFGPTGDTLHLAGGGSVMFDSPVAFTTAEFHFTTSQGPV